MKTLFPILILLFTLFSSFDLYAQKNRRVTSKPVPASGARSKEIGKTAVVMDETLSVLRVFPSLFAEGIQRMRRGREVKILGVSEADGVKFFKVTAEPKNYGWVQADAVFGKFRPDDEERLAKLVQAMNGFDQIELAAFYFTLYPDSKYSPAILLLFGDLCQETAIRLSKDATSRLDRREMAASAAPLHSYYLNYVGLDRYRKLGVTFRFNATTKLYYYDGASWRRLVEKFGTSPEAAEARKRLETIGERSQAGAQD
ncbi:MAG: hypothetical protein ACJ72Z_12945 [Pyrinomonadaceae bacterium]